MHISEGVLSIPVLLMGGLCSGVGLAIGLKQLEDERIPQVAVLSAAFFVISLIHLPLGPANVHLVLHGLLGLILGWAAFPALFIALLLQALLFGFGGLSVLGVNTTVLALPAILCFYLFQPLVHKATTNKVLFVYGSGAGILAIALSTFLMAFSLLTTGETFGYLVQLMWIAHLPVMLVEGVITGMVIIFLRQVRPESLKVAHA